ncbi:histidine--tRNA ligase [Pseudomonadota bacterium]
MGSVKAVRGMNDILPPDSAVWQEVESQLRTIFHIYSYREVRLPVLEKTELFARSIGDATDIVAKEMYTFDDRNGESLTLRPEATASCVRAGIENGMFHNQCQRLWYMGPMFRHERPQRGRYRQFYQAGAEAFGWTGPDTDAELIAMSSRFWSSMNLKISPRLEINSLGDADSRAGYRDRLLEYLLRYEDELDVDSRKRLRSNPLRILDSKDPDTRKILQGAPVLFDYIDPESREHFDKLCTLLGDLGIPFSVNEKLVRGLDYYNRTVFEWVTDELGSQSAVCAGGRYDGLVQQLGGRNAVPAAGFALGMDRLVDLASMGGTVHDHTGPDVYVITLGARARAQGWIYAEQIRDQGFKVEMFCGDGGMKNQMKRADKSGATLGLVLGDDEIDSGSATLKRMRGNGGQETVAAGGLVAAIRELTSEQRQ